MCPEQDSDEGKIQGPRLYCPAWCLIMSHNRSLCACRYFCYIHNPLTSPFSMLALTTIILRYGHGPIPAWMLRGGRLLCNNCTSAAAVDGAIVYAPGEHKLPPPPPPPPGLLPPGGASPDNMDYMPILEIHIGGQPSRQALQRIHCCRQSPACQANCPVMIETVLSGGFAACLLINSWAAKAAVHAAESPGCWQSLPAEIRHPTSFP